MDKYECPCEYVYDPETGDTQSIKPGTLFENLPDYWVCPLCEAEKDYFERLD
ncbi:MAG: rubredoxin [Desulfobacterales bacterium]|nr:rubredoxin [Desulfobacterales bacterium]